MAGGGTRAESELAEIVPIFRARIHVEEDIGVFSSSATTGEAFLQKPKGVAAEAVVYSIQEIESGRVLMRICIYNGIGGHAAVYPSSRKKVLGIWGIRLVIKCARYRS